MVAVHVRDEDAGDLAVLEVRAHELVLRRLAAVEEPYLVRQAQRVGAHVARERGRSRGRSQERHLHAAKVGIAILVDALAAGDALGGAAAHDAPLPRAGLRIAIAGLRIAARILLGRVIARGLGLRRSGLDGDWPERDEPLDELGLLPVRSLAPARQLLPQVANLELLVQDVDDVPAGLGERLVDSAGSRRRREARGGDDEAVGGGCRGESCRGARDRREDPHERRVVADAPAVTATRGAAWT